MIFGVITEPMSDHLSTVLWPHHHFSGAGVLSEIMSWKILSSVTTSGVAVVKSHRATMGLLRPGIDRNVTPMFCCDIDETSKRTLVTAFLLVVSNVIGYSLQNGVLVSFIVLVSY